MEAPHIITPQNTGILKWGAGESEKGGVPIVHLYFEHAGRVINVCTDSVELLEQMADTFVDKANWIRMRTGKVQRIGGKYHQDDE